MLPHLTRKAFPDRPWAAADLDAVAEFWLRLYEAAARHQGFAPTPAHAVEVRLRGFPRHAADALQLELCRRVAYSDLPAPEVFAPDPDTLVVASGPIDGGESPPAGLGLPLLAGDPFDGLLAEVRVGTAGREGAIVRGTVRTTLVLVGELRGGGLLLKGVWRAGASGWEDDLCWKAAWPEEGAWLAAFDRFRETGEVPARLAKRLFATTAADRLSGRLVRLINAQLGKPRAAGLLARAAVFALLFAAVGAGAWWAVAADRWLLTALVAAASWWVFLLAGYAARTEWRLLVTGYGQFRARYQRLYDEAARVVPLPRAAADAALAHPWGRKYTADLEAAGFAYLGDLRTEPPVGGEGVIRVFLAPDGVTYLNVVFVTSTDPEPGAGFRIWPAVVALVAHTYFPDGGRVSGVQGRHLGYRRKRTGADHRVRLHPEGEDAVAFAARHGEAVAAFGREWGRGPAGHEDFARYVRRQQAAQEEERLLYADAPYTWGDHLRWYLQTPRREYRG